MTNPEALPERVDRIEQKLDSLSVSVDRRFNEVSDALLEQRQYTEFAFERADKALERLDKGLTAMDVKLDEVLQILRRR